ncbi:MAG: tetratricopeptide repeat protein, partial [Proteobacteria bacterium]|nr:tetratricopeptide repeat protein [Pseudomonadota bacterium]
MDLEQRQAIQQQITGGHFEAALEACESALAVSPDDADLLYMAAVCERYLGHYDPALTRIARLKSLVPEHGRAFQEEGHVYRDRGDSTAALRAYANACQYNPALISSWRGQLDILEKQGRAPQADLVCERLAQLQVLPRPLLGVMDLISQGKLVKAEDICRQFLQKVPHHVEGMRLLADIGARLGVLDDAEFLLESAVAFQPDHVQVRMDYIHVLRKRQKFQAALDEAKILLAMQPDNVRFLSLYAIESRQTGDYDKALVIFDRVLENVPGDPFTLTSRGHALKTVGRYEAAVDSYQQVIEQHPSHGEAYYSLANLKTYRFDDLQLQRMREQQGSPDLNYMDRVYLAFALGKAFED